MRLLLFLVSFLPLFSAPLSITVSIPPYIELVKALGGDQVLVRSMVPVGTSPHHYEPKPSQMRHLKKSQLYFTAGLQFENVWLERFKEHNPHLNITPLYTNIERNQDHAHGAHCDHGDEMKGIDPHIWLSPKLLIIQINTMTEALIHTLPEHKKMITNNQKRLLKRLNDLDMTLRRDLLAYHESAFMVFHPSWGYFAKEYHLHQIAVEEEGKSPRPAQLARLIKRAKKEFVKTIIVHPEFSDQAAKAIAHELNIPVVKISPLAPDVFETFHKTLKAIQGKPL